MACLIWTGEFGIIYWYFVYFTGEAAFWMKCAVLGVGWEWDGVFPIPIPKQLPIPVITPTVLGGWPRILYVCFHREEIPELTFKRLFTILDRRQRLGWLGGRTCSRGIWEPSAPRTILRKKIMSDIDTANQRDISMLWAYGRRWVRQAAKKKGFSNHVDKRFSDYLRT